MDKRVILAVAGAGKTYYICHAVDPLKKNLILAYTNENISNILHELVQAYGKVPELTNVMTFDAFLYRYMLLPFEPSVLEHFIRAGLKTRGITTLSSPPQRIKNSSGRMVPNGRYKKKDSFDHYITAKRQYYCDTLSELIMQVKRGRNSLIKRIATVLNTFYSQVLIDEFQDFREHDYDLIIALAKNLNNITLVGDYFQHSVSAVNNTGKPFKIKQRYVSYEEFIESLNDCGFAVDTDTLKESRRCSRDICQYVNSKLGINIESFGNNHGSVSWVDDNIIDILNNDNIIKLVYREPQKYKFNAMSWSYSKGDTFNSVCVILINDLNNMDHDDFSCSTIAPSTKNKLYVAMTRSRGDLYLIKDSTFKNIKDQFLK